MVSGGARGRARKGATIFDSVGSGQPTETIGQGSIPGCGTYSCLNCGARLALQETDCMPACPRCGRSRFRRASIFASREERAEATAEVALPREQSPPEWLPRTRAGLGPGQHLAYRDEIGEIVTRTIERGWTRIGRSPRSDLRLDDPSVSRRHALIVAEPGKALQVLDDRSLNGVLVNGKAVDLGTLRDGDRLTIGRFELYAIEI